MNGNERTASSSEREQGFLQHQPGDSDHLYSQPTLRGNAQPFVSDASQRSVRFPDSVPTTHNVNSTTSIIHDAPVDNQRSKLPTSRMPTSGSSRDEDYNARPFVPTGPPNSVIRYLRPPNNGVHSTSRRVAQNDVDSWIDELDPSRCSVMPNLTSGVGPDTFMSWMVQQYLPKIELPVFDGAPLDWVDFVIKFRDIVHRQPYLADSQRHQLLQQHLRGEAKSSVRGYINDVCGYVMSLQTLKHLFGRRSTISRAVLQKVVKGKQIGSDDVKALSAFYYSINECLVTLKQLNHISDLHSSETLQQAIQRLPIYLQHKWCERSFSVSRTEEPSLLHLGVWLRDRLLAMQEIARPEQRRFNPKSDEKPGAKHVNVVTSGKNVVLKCKICNGEHNFWKCQRYKDMEGKKRAELVKKLKVCVNCFNAEHDLGNCTSRTTCFEKDCKAKHHTSLHKYIIEGGELLTASLKDGKTTAAKGNNNEKNTPAKKDEGEGLKVKFDVEDAKNYCLMGSVPKIVYLQIVPVTLHAGRKHLKTYALLDDASQATLIREDMAAKLGLEGRKDTFYLSTINETAKQVQCTEVSLDVSARNGKNRHKIQSVHLQPTESFNMPSRPSLKHIDDEGVHTHLEGLEFPAVSPDEVTILIGANCPEAHICSEVRRGNCGPLAMKTIFGWTLFGPAGNASKPGKSVHCSTVLVGVDPVNSSLPPRNLFVNKISMSREDISLNESVERFWLQEHVGILPPKEVAMSRDDLRALDTMEKHTKLLPHGHYEVPMLWDKSQLPLPDNMSLVKKRFAFLQKKLRAKKDLHAMFKKQIDSYLVQDPPYARKLTKEEANARSAKTWYLPIHPVENPNKPGKVRVVNDGAAEYRGVSLNKALRSGPDLLNSLVGVLIRFRTNKVAVSADVEGMFHQVRVKPEDADALRFLWKDDITSDEDPEVYQMCVHVFGATDSPTCANYALQKTARDNANEFDPLTVESGLKAFYVDDLLKSVHSVKTAISLAKELMQMLQKGGFRLTKFMSNNKEVLDALPPSEVSPSVTLQLETEDKLQRALGISWDTNKDVFTFIIQLKDADPTKRGILKTTSSVFDPLGFLSAFILVAKLILQSLWMQGKDWDEVIDEETQKRWSRWLAGAKNLPRVQLNRCYMQDDRAVMEIQLHIFCDASELAFGCVAYVRYSFKTGGHATSFVMSKSRLAPIKIVTLPRLELNAARCGARLSHLIVHELDLPIQRVQFWSDSTLTLQYINNSTNRLKVFVANRVANILDLSQPQDWRHVPGNVNTADLLTRGVNDPSELMKNRWFTGPQFLELDEEEWPVLDVATLDKNDIEIRKKSILVATTIVETHGINLTRISSWSRLQRVVAWVIRFAAKWRTVAKEGKKDQVPISEPISLEEVMEAEDVLFRDVQKSAFQTELRMMSEGKAVLPSSHLAKLSPYVDESGILRVGGRLKNMPIPRDMKHPTILPGTHQVTKILIEHFHRKHGHVGPEHVLTLLRERFWIISARSSIRQVCHNCFFCRVRRAKEQFPFMADLPLFRAAIEEPAFCHCGVDLFGPIHVKQGRKRLKRWVVLFTCLTIRCIHLDVVGSCETDTFLNALRRFTNRRGCPTNMYSDNGTNFKGATTELKEFVLKLEQDEEKIINFTTSRKIKWTFNPPSAPHMGGAWERLVRSSKEVMYGLVKDHVLTDPQLYTLLTEAEMIINSRPLTHLSDDINDLEPLTPNHVLLGMHRNWASIADTSEYDITSRRKWKQVQALRATFWKRWTKEYLPTLAERSRWTSAGPTFEVGELVLLKNDDLKRNKWPLARIEETICGKDGVVRVAVLRTKDGTYTRPVAKILKLEDNDSIRGGRNVGDT